MKPNAYRLGIQEDLPVLLSYLPALLHLLVAASLLFLLLSLLLWLLIFSKGFPEQKREKSFTHYLPNVERSSCKACDSIPAQTAQFNRLTVPPKVQKRGSKGWTNLSGPGPTARVGQGML